MHSQKTLQCYNCMSTILSLPIVEISRLDGLSFQCECCGHQNILSENGFKKSSNSDPLLNIMSVETLMSV